MPGTRVARGLSPFFGDKATYPLMAIFGLGMGYVGYNMFRHVAYNPDVKVNREYRGTTVFKGKWELRPATQNWVKDHDVKYPHKDYDVSKIGLLDFMTPKYWAQRSEVHNFPDQFTRSGVSRGE